MGMIIFIFNLLYSHSSVISFVSYIVGKLFLLTFTFPGGSHFFFYFFLLYWLFSICYLSPPPSFMPEHLSVSLASWLLMRSPHPQGGKIVYVLLENITVVLLNWKLRWPSWLYGAPLATGGIGCLLKRYLVVATQNSQWKAIVQDSDPAGMKVWFTLMGADQE